MKACISCWMAAVAVLALALIFGSYAVPGNTDFGHSTAEIHRSIGLFTLLVQFVGLGAWMTWPK